MSKQLWFSVTMADCDEEHFTVGGHGGSGKDTSNTGVRIRHRASGATGESRNERSQVQNKRQAFLRMANSQKFKTWHKMECARRSGQKSVDELVEEALQPSNLRVEVREDGRWQVVG